MTENNTRHAAYTPKLRLREKLGFGAFSMASNVVYQFKSMYYLFFLSEVLLIPMRWAGAILAAGMVWDAINDPLIGFWAVNHRFKSGEKYRPMALWFSVPWAISLVLLFTDFGTKDSTTIVIAIIVYVVFESFNTTADIPYNSMGALATNRDEDRRAINIFRSLGGICGAGLGSVTIMPLLAVMGALDRDGNLIRETGRRGFFMVAVIMGCVCVAGCLTHYLTTRERVKPVDEREDKISLVTGFAMLLKTRAWVFNMLYIMCYSVINTITLNCINYYATYVLGSTSASMPIMATYLAVSVATAAAVAPIDRRLGRKGTMLMAVCVFIAGKVWFILDPYSLPALYVNAVTVGVAVTIAYIMFNTNRNNITDLVEWRQGRRIDSLVTTADNLATKLVGASALWFLSFLMDSGGYNAELSVQPQGAVDAITSLLGWIPALVGVAMLVVVLMQRLDGDMAQMRKEKGLTD